MTSVEVEIPADPRPSRIGPRAERTPAGDPDDIGTVDSKVQSFWGFYEDGGIETDIEVTGTPDLPVYTVTAHVWKDATRPRPSSTAHATRTLGVGDEPYCDYPLETAESVAIGRALRFLNINGA